MSSARTLPPEEIFEALVARDLSYIPGDTASHAAGWMSHLDAGVFESQVRRCAQLVGRTRRQVFLLGIGGSSSGAGMYAQAGGDGRMTILDTSCPEDLDGVDFANSTVIAASKSGTTIETTSALALALRAGLDPAELIVVTDQGSKLEALARSLGARVLSGDPDTGGRYSAFSAFGVAGALGAGWSADELLGLARPDASVARSAFVDGLERGRSVREGELATYVLPGDPLMSFGALWEEQLVAESTGKRGVGFVPVAGPRLDVSRDDVLIHAWSRHWWTVGASIGLGVDPFDQPDVESAKREVRDILAGKARSLKDAGSASISDADYIALQIFSSVGAAREARDLRSRLEQPGRVVTASIGPRYLHSTGQLHKGGPRGLLALQVVVKPTSDIRVPGALYSFGELFLAQADGDALALLAAGQRVARIYVDGVDQLADVDISGAVELV